MEYSGVNRLSRLTAILIQFQTKRIVTASELSGFTGCINWYRNLDRNWLLMVDVKPLIKQPTLMIYGDRDLIPKSQSLKYFAPNLELVSLDCGHWIPQEKPGETNQVILNWLEKQDAKE